MYNPTATRNRPGVALAIIVGVTLCAALFAPRTAAGQNAIAEFSQVPAAIRTDLQGLAPSPVTQLDDNSIAASALDTSTKSDLEAQGATEVTGNCSNVLGGEIADTISQLGEPLVCGD